MIAKMKARDFRCSFCGKSRGEVSTIMTGAPPATARAPRPMIGKNPFICNECVRRYHQLISADIASRPLVVPE